MDPALTEGGFGFVNVLAMTSPIYAKGVIAQDIGTGDATWVAIENDGYVTQEYLDNVVRDLGRVSPPVNYNK